MVMPSFEAHSEVSSCSMVSRVCYLVKSLVQNGPCSSAWHVWKFTFSLGQLMQPAHKLMDYIFSAVYYVCHCDLNLAYCNLGKGVSATRTGMETVVRSQKRHASHNAIVAGCISCTDLSIELLAATLVTSRFATLVTSGLAKYLYDSIVGNHDSEAE